MFFTSIVAIFTLCWGISSATNSSAVGANCIITDYSHVSQVTSSCTNIIIKNLNVPAQKTLTLQLKKGAAVTFEGTTTFGVAHWDGPLVQVYGDDVKVTGAAGSKLDGAGPKYWNGKGGPGKPTFMYVHGSGHYSNMNLMDCPQRCVVFVGNNYLIEGWNIIVNAKQNWAGNTDGIGVTGNDITVRNCVIKNQDDCVVTGAGKNIHVSNVHCYGSHGLSLSVGGHTASNVTFTDCSLTDARIGIHIKNVKGMPKGLIEDVTYNRITLSGIYQYGIHIQQDYPQNDGKPDPNVPFKGITLNDIKGTLHGKNTMAVKVTCAAGACSNWKFSNIHITGNTKPCSMNYHPAGFSC